MRFSEYPVEWYQLPQLPGSLSEGAGSPQGLTEGVSFDGCSGPMVIRKPLLALKFLSGYVHRTTLPQSRFARQLPQRGSRGTFPFNRVLAKIQRYGRFSSPLRNSKDLTFHHSSDDTPSVTPVGRDSSLREGAGKRSHSPGYSLESGVGGRFSSPLRRLRRHYIPPFNEKTT